MAHHDAETSVDAHEKQIELTPIHDFAAKMIQPAILPRVKEYVRRQAELRGQAGEGGSAAGAVPDFAPVSINLDLTTTCNFRCDHCVDMKILNKPFRFEHDKLLASMELMAEKGLKSVIVIGGGEPTTYKYFGETMRFMKKLGLQVSIVSNGSGMDRIREVADCFEPCDWVRLSLDSGTDPTFQAMHKPVGKITLESICEKVPEVKAVNAGFPIGFSFIITWKGATIHDASIVENLPEIVTATELARDHGFDYIAMKPFLTRAEANNAEIVDLRESDRHFDEVVARIQAEVAKAKKFETDDFKVYETTNLKMLYNRSAADFMNQPRHCHMQFFRQVMSPLGMYNCPVYRNQAHGKVGTKNAYADRETFDETRGCTGGLIDTFNATEQCKEVTCLYNHVNWWLEAMIEDPRRLDGVEAVQQPVEDYFL